MNNNSPLESLAAFVITFVAGALSAVTLSRYVEWVKRKERRTETLR